MKKAASKKTPLLDSHNVITLDESQMTIYLTQKIDICSPSGEVLTGISRLVDDKVIEHEREMAVDNFHLLEDLLRGCNSNQLDISERGALGLANAFWQAQKMIGN